MQIDNPKLRTFVQDIIILKITRAGNEHNSTSSERFAYYVSSQNVKRIIFAIKEGRPSRVVFNKVDPCTWPGTCPLLQCTFVSPPPRSSLPNLANAATFPVLLLEYTRYYILHKYTSVQMVCADGWLDDRLCLSSPIESIPVKSAIEGRPVVFSP